MRNTASIVYSRAKLSLEITYDLPIISTLLPLFFNDHVILNNHSSERLLLYRNSKSSSALHAYNTADDSDVILSNQLRNSPSTTRSSFWNANSELAARPPYVHDITLHEHIIINPSTSMDSAHHQLTVHIHIDHLRSPSNNANITKIASLHYEHSAIKPSQRIHDAWSTSNNHNSNEQYE